MSENNSRLYLIWVPGPNNTKLYLHPHGDDYIVREELLGAAMWTQPNALNVNRDILRGKGTLELAPMK